MSPEWGTEPLWSGDFSSAPDILCSEETLFISVLYNIKAFCFSFGGVENKSYSSLYKQDPKIANFFHKEICKFKAFIFNTEGVSNYPTEYNMKTVILGETKDPSNPVPCLQVAHSRCLREKYEVEQAVKLPQLSLLWPKGFLSQRHCVYV